MIYNYLKNLGDRRNGFFISMFICLSVFSFIILALEVFLGIRLNLFFPNDRFADFFKTIDGLQLAEVWQTETIYDLGLTVNYFPPLLVFLYFLFAKILVYTEIHKIFVYAFYIFIPLTIFFYSLKNFVSAYIQILLILVSFPILYVVERGNPALWVVAFIFLSYRFKENIFLASFFLSIAVSLKITPIIFFLLICSKNPKRAAFQTIFFVFCLFSLNYFAVNILSLSNSNYNPYNFFSSLKIYENLYINKLGGLNYGASLFMPIYFLLIKLNCLFIQKINPYIISMIMCFITFVWSSKSYFIKYIISLNWIRIDILSIVFILFTPVTGIYYLLLMLGSLLIRFNTLGKNELFCYFILMSPKVILFSGIELGAFINPLVLLILLNTTIHKDIFDYR